MDFPGPRSLGQTPPTSSLYFQNQTKFKNATIGHFEYPRYSQGTDYGSNEFPTAKNLGLDTKMKSLANLEPSQWETHDFILFLVLAEEFLSCNKNYSLNKS